MMPSLHSRITPSFRCITIIIICFHVVSAVSSAPASFIVNRRVKIISSTRRDKFATIGSTANNNCMRAKKDKAGSDDEVVSIIHSHHLLDHKPDNMILSGKKFKLRGIACLGRPGVALC